MPIYEYSCRKCNAHIEVIQKITDKPLARHEKCGGKLDKEFSRTGFQFKGDGWYVTDYAGKKSETKEATEPASLTKSEPKEKSVEKAKREKSSSTKTTAASSDS